MDAKKEALFLLPYASLKYNLKNSQNLKLIYRQSVSYPGFYQLNPSAFTSDPFTVNTGNPNLEPEIHHLVQLEYSRTFKNHFISLQLFRQQTSGAIRDLMTVSENPVFEIRKMNLGEIRETGVLFTGSLGFGKFGINPYLKIADMYSLPNFLARKNNISRQHLLAVETSLSAFAALNKGFSVSASFQYNSPKNEIQGSSFSDALYFISFEKSFTNGLKVGFTAGAPCIKRFTYQGSKVVTTDFSHYSEGVVNLSDVPLWFKISYSFSSGKKREKIEHSGTEPQREIKKGF